ncbi:hypothetical protein C8R47DRAFT_1211357 [Mycena vitilis]|nr:hypothetical protein C8R47DRAFT_1211357 [Mycena vitilis]
MSQAQLFLALLAPSDESILFVGRSNIASSSCRKKAKGVEQRGALGQRQAQPGCAAAAPPSAARLHGQRAQRIDAEVEVDEVEEEKDSEVAHNANPHGEVGGRQKTRTGAMIQRQICWRPWMLQRKGR